MLKNVIFLILISSFNLSAQIDSLFLELEKPTANSELVDEINDIFSKIYYQNPTATLTYAKNLDSLVDIQGFTTKKDLSQLCLGIAYIVNEEYDEATFYLLRADSISEVNGNIKVQAQAYNNLAVAWQVRKDEKSTALYFEKALSLYKELKDTLWIGIINLNLGGLYMEDNLLEKADPYLVDAIQLMERLNQPIYTGYGKLNLGSLRVKQGQYKSAIPFLNDALELVPQKVNPLIHAVGNTALGEAYLKTDEIKKAKEYLDEGYSISTRIKQFEQLEAITILLAEYYEKTGDLGQAIAFLKENSSLRDSFISKEEDERLVDALKKYESEKKEQKIEILSQQNELKDLRIQKNRRNLLLALLSLMGSLVIIGTVIISRNRIKKLNIALEEQKNMVSKNLKEKELLLKEIHHRVKNNLQIISSLLNLQSDYVTNESAAAALNVGKNRVKSMALIHQNLYQEGNLMGVDLKSYFEKLCLSLFNSYNIEQDKIKLDLQVADINLDIDHVIPLGLIANELISNALKYAFNGEKHGLVTVVLAEKDKGISLLVRDNGKGFDTSDIEHQTNSFGYQMIYAFKEKLEADLILESKNGFSAELIFFNKEVV